MKRNEIRKAKKKKICGEEGQAIESLVEDQEEGGD